MKRIVILGSTGSIGQNTLEVIKKFQDKFEVLAIAARSNVSLLTKQIEIFRPRYVAVYEKRAYEELKERVKDCEILLGLEGICEVAKLEQADIVISAIVGAAGLIPTLEAIKAGKLIGLANKESLVIAGNLIIDESIKKGAKIIPIDSEHSAVFQCLNGCGAETIRKIWLTASGGPFRGKKIRELENVTPLEALNHPKWKMGKRITVDSATLMNKGFEVIEAHFLFNISPENIGVLIHPQSIVHSLVEFIDGTYLAQMSIPDMKAPIAFALSWPERLPDVVSPINWSTLKTLEFELPDTKTFPCLELAYMALKSGGSMTAVLNAADEVAVEAFLLGKLKFIEIPKIIREVMNSHIPRNPSSIEEILEIDKWARKKAWEAIDR